MRKNCEGTWLQQVKKPRYLKSCRAPKPLSIQRKHCWKSVMKVPQSTPALSKRRVLYPSAMEDCLLSVSPGPGLPRALSAQKTLSVDVYVYPQPNPPPPIYSVTSAFFIAEIIKLKAKGLCSPSLPSFISSVLPPSWPRSLYCYVSGTTPPS